MRVADFSFELPDRLIARHPLPERRASRLLVLDGPQGSIEHRQFGDLPGFLRAGDLLVFNDTRVIPARLFGQKASGGKLEILVERVLDAHRVLAHVRSSKSPKPGSQILLDGGGQAQMLARHDALFELEFSEEVLPLLDRIGHMPLPPYIDRPDEAADRERYQTVYGAHAGAGAAPTAGLHFDAAMLQSLAQMGVETAFVTLHVGAGTFQPVRVERIEDHHMHSEWLQVDATLVEQVRRISEGAALITGARLDFQMPERFDLKFTNQNGEMERPVVIHRALLGSLERFIGVYLEHVAGAFPFWLAPEQVRVIPIALDFNPHGEALGEGEALRISTGAVLPPGADAVVAQEDCAVHGEHVEVDRDRVGAFGPGHFVRAAGSDVAASSLLLPAGVTLGPGELALLAGCGHSVVYVRRTPRVAILCTGDELVPVGAWPQRGQVVSSNGLMLAWQAREAGAEVIDLGVAGDEPGSLRVALERGLAADVLVTCGGISVGDHDLVLPTLIGLGAALVFRRVRLRPGRPTTLLQVSGPAGPVPVFALPGNPASAHVAFELFVRPALRRMLGHDEHLRPQRQVVLTGPAPRDSRRVHMIRARVVGDQATPLPDQTSGALRSIAGHDALVELSPGTGPLAAGATATAWMLRPT